MSINPFVLLVAALVFSPVGLSAADDSPASAIDPVTTLVALDRLSHDLEHAPPTDPRLASAQMAFIDLALCADPRDRGGRGGIWRQRARELRDLRIAAGVHAATFEEAVPDLWVDALDGRVLACQNALRRFPEAAASPHARALRCYLTTDWRELRAATDLTSYEQIALACAYARCGMGQALQHMEHRNIPAFCYGVLLVWSTNFSHEGTSACLRCAEDEAAGLIGVVDSPSVQPLETAFATAAGAPEATPAAVRRRLLQPDTQDRGEIVLAAWKLADALGALPGRLRDPDGTWHFAGAHERGTAARLAVLLATWNRHSFVRFQWGIPETADQLSKPICAGDDGVLGTLIRGDVTGWKNPSDGQALLQAITKELDRGDGAIPPMRLVGVVNQVRECSPPLVEPTTQMLEQLAARHAATESTGAAGWEEVATCLSDAGRLDAAREGIIAAAAADPYSIILANFSKLLGDGSIPLWPGDPKAQWIDANVDHETGQFPQAGRSDRIGVRWRGQIVVASEGTYRFATDSDDGSTLMIDGHPIVENGGDHATKRVIGSCTLSVGRHPIDLRWFNTQGGACCRLFWQPPGANDVTLVPPAALETPEGAPGLAAAVWLLDATPPERTAGGANEEALARMPWRLDLASKRFHQLCDQGRWADAVHIAESILHDDPGNARVGRRYGAALKQLGQTEAAIAAWKAYLAASDDFDTIFVRGDVATALEAQGDFAGAETYFVQAANSWQATAMLACGEFLGRRGRGRDGLVWIDRTIERYDSKLYHLTAASVLLASDKPSPADVDEAMRRIHDHRELIPTFREAWKLCERIEVNGLHDRFLALLDNSWHQGRNGLPVKVGIMLTVSGRAAEGADWFAQELARQGMVRDDAIGYIASWQTLAARLAKRPDLAVSADVLRQRIGHERFIPPIDPLLRYLVGDRSREAAIADAGNDADELLYYLAFDAAAAGDLAQVRQDFSKTIEKHPTDAEAGDARRLLQWLEAGATLTPSTKEKGDF